MDLKMNRDEELKIERNWKWWGNFNMVVGFIILCIGFLYIFFGG